MSTQWLPNVTRILSAARTYKRACGKVRTAERGLADDNIRTRQMSVVTLAMAREEKESAATRLLWLIETGAKSTNKMPKVKS